MPLVVALALWALRGPAFDCKSPPGRHAVPESRCRLFPGRSHGRAGLRDVSYLI